MAKNNNAYREYAKIGHESFRERDRIAEESRKTEQQKQIEGMSK